MDVNQDYSTQTIGKYVLAEKLGQGRFGAVYRARDMVLDSEKAIKIMNVSDPSQAFKLFEEAAIPHKCAHSNIVSINGGSLESYEGALHFVIDMELVEGGSLEDAIKKGVSVLEALDVVKSMLFGLQHSHNQGIVHRDIKPANVLLSKGIPKLSDFGLAAALNSVLPPSEKWYLTHAAPEIWSTRTPTVETDIFAVGVTMYRVVNNISDWKLHLDSIKGSQLLLKNGTLVEKAKFAPHVPRRVVRVVKKACKPDPENRYHSASEMRDDIEKLFPQVNWRTIDKTSWIGTAGAQEQRIEILPKRSGFELQLKVNGRRNTAKCQRFDSEDDARRQMLKYISETTLK